MYKILMGNFAAITLKFLFQRSPEKGLLKVSDPEKGIE